MIEQNKTGIEFPSIGSKYTKDQKTEKPFQCFQDPSINSGKPNSHFPSFQKQQQAPQIMTKQVSKNTSSSMKRRRNTDSTLVVDKPFQSKKSSDMKRRKSEAGKQAVAGKKDSRKSKDEENTNDNGNIDIAFLLNDKTPLKTQASGKLPYSYATLITYAILHHPEKKMTLSEIYAWLLDKFPHFKTGGTGWKNSIRHNLSLNKTFVRVPRPLNQPGKGAYWAVDLSVLSESIYSKSKARRNTTDSIKMPIWQQTLHGNLAPNRSSIPVNFPRFGIDSKNRQQPGVHGFHEKVISPLNNAQYAINGIPQKTNKGTQKSKKTLDKNHTFHEISQGTNSGLLKMPIPHANLNQPPFHTIPPYHFNQSMPEGKPLMQLPMNQHLLLGDHVIGDMKLDEYLFGFQPGLGDTYAFPPQNATKDQNKIGLTNGSNANPQKSNIYGQILDPNNDFPMLNLNDVDLHNLGGLPNIDGYNPLLTNNDILFDEDMLPSCLKHATLNDSTTNGNVQSPAKRESNSLPYIFYEDQMGQFSQTNDSNFDKSKEINKPLNSNETQSNGVQLSPLDNISKESTSPTKVGPISNHQSLLDFNKIAQDFDNGNSSDKVDTNYLNTINSMEMYLMPEIGNDKIFSGEFFGTQDIPLDNNFLNNVGGMVNVSDTRTNPMPTEFGSSEIEYHNSDTKENHINSGNKQAFRNLPVDLDIQEIQSQSPSEPLKLGKNTAPNITKDVFVGNQYDDQKSNGLKFDAIFNQYTGNESEWMGKII
ncbi:hypothetical protein BB560_003378 [Smittium megazygosporum]|uniref:Fork-head domain-containing protein n=1 Tax=Smittium megazygosporum TaxID=133381 RepID=A0A2T9ZC73_9FUNG|nr:hypothetical protein BB560_003378 [Smittium megazygosporum]